MSRLLSDLTPAMRSKAVEFLSKCLEEKIPLMVIDTLRTPKEQEENIKKGVSWTKNSKHLPGPDGKSRAIDVCPYKTFVLHGENKLQWDQKDPVWAKIGAIGESLGLTWGGRWVKTPDWGHFQLDE